MNNDSSFSIIGDEPVEARIVAWVLGEASAFEVEELERLCVERPELLVFKRRMRALHGLLAEAEAAQSDDGWKLPAEKRRALDEVFGAPQKTDTEPVVERRVKRAGIRALLAIAACVVAAVVILQLVHPIVVMRKSVKSHEPMVSFMPSSDEPMVQSAEAPAKRRAREVASSRPAIRGMVDDRMKSSKRADVKTKRVEELAGRSYSNAEGKTVASGELDAPADSFGDMSAVSSLGYSNGGSGAGLGFGGLPSVTGKTDREALAAGGEQVDKTLSDPVGLGGAASGMKWANPGDGEKTPQETKPNNGAKMANVRVPTQDELPAVGQLFKKENAKTNGENQPVDGKETEVSLTGEASDMPLPEMDGFVNFGTPIAERGLDARATVDPASRPGEEPSDSMLAEREGVRRGAQGSVPAKPQAAQAAESVLSNEISAAEDPYSTFSLNVSDASFKIAQAALAKGDRPDPAGVKVEQFYNAVDYGDPAPSGAMPVALAAERCAHPVIPGRDLVRVSVKTSAAGRGASQPLRLTLLVDQSGSMVRADRREAMEKALSSLAGLLTANDRVSLIGFSRTPHLLADGMIGDQAGGLPGMVHQEAAEGGTNLEEAIKLAEQLAKRHKLAGAQNRIVLFTDGAANLGDARPASLADRVKSLRQSGFAFDIAGIAADDINDGLLAELARHGNGRYSIVGKGDDAQFAERLAGAFRPAAENVKVQVRFNPERVARYKLIGFEKDRLKTEDFRNDSVDAAEMAAEEAGVALYQIETIPGGRGELGEVSVRFRDVAAGGEMVERSIVLSHAGAAPAIDKATPSMQLAALSLLAAEKLRGGPLGAAVDFSRLAGPRGSVRAHYGPGSRAAEMLQVIDRIQ